LAVKRVIIFVVIGLLLGVPIGWLSALKLWKDDEKDGGRFRLVVEMDYIAGRVRMGTVRSDTKAVVLPEAGEPFDSVPVSSGSGGAGEDYHAVAVFALDQQHSPLLPGSRALQGRHLIATRIGAEMSFDPEHVRAKTIFLELLRTKGAEAAYDFAREWALQVGGKRQQETEAAASTTRR
jgi:hypothetical protein